MLSETSVYTRDYTKGYLNNIQKMEKFVCRRALRRPKQSEAIACARDGKRHRHPVMRNARSRTSRVT
jgi:hypothetical protein